MAEMNEREKWAVAKGIATLMSLARHSLSPTQTEMATKSAGHLLWLMGVEQYVADGRIFVAVPPEGDTIDVEATRLLEGAQNG